MMTDYATPQLVLRDILRRNPGATLHEIRDAHPVFRAISLDQLGLRLARMIEALSDPRAK